MVTCMVLIATTIIDGFKIAESPLFIAIELFLNLLISVDLLCRVRMVGFKKYLLKDWWNKLDLIIVIGCTSLFVFSIIYKASANEISEELLLILWSSFQCCRMLVIAKKQRMAQNSAKHLIDFANIGIETETLDVAGRRQDDVGDIEEVIEF